MIPLQKAFHFIIRIAGGKKKERGKEKKRGGGKKRREEEEKDGDKRKKTIYLAGRLTALNEMFQSIYSAKLIHYVKTNKLLYQ